MHNTQLANKHFALSRNSACLHSARPERIKVKSCRSCCLLHKFALFSQIISDVPAWSCCRHKFMYLCTTWRYSQLSKTSTLLDSAPKTMAMPLDYKGPGGSIFWFQRLYRHLTGHNDNRHETTRSYFSKRDSNRALQIKPRSLSLQQTFPDIPSQSSPSSC